MAVNAIESVRALTGRLNQYRDEYYNHNAPSVSDEVYDRLFDELSDLEEKTGCVMSNSPTQTVGFAVVDGLEKTRHDTPLLSLYKTKSFDEILRFAQDRPLLIMHKLDGLTVKLEYEGGALIRASTRGDGSEGEIITHNMAAVAGVPLRIPYMNRLVVTGEAHILNGDFARLKDTLLDSGGKPYKNPRNLAAGSIRCLDAGACAKRCVRFTPFNVLEGLDEQPDMADSKFVRLNHLHHELGFSRCGLFLAVNYTSEDLQTAIEELRESAKEKGVPIDGIVLTYNDIAFSKEQGRTGHHYKDGIAFKFEDDLYETVLRGIEWMPTRFGEISPVALFDTVEIDGCEVSRASLFHLTFIRGQELMPGCRILVCKRNMIIPYVESNLDRGRFDENGLFPEHCPCCGEKTRIDSSGIADVLFCDNPNCRMKRLRQFVHFASKKAMDIEGLSEATLEKFIAKGWIESFTDIYRLDRYQRDICTADGFGLKSWQRLWDSIQKSRNTTFERFLISMDIPMIGNTASRELSRAFCGDLGEFEAAVGEGYDFTRLNDFGTTLHGNIHEWFCKNENKKLWKELQTMLNIEKTQLITADVKSNPFIGRTIVVTGKLEHFTRNSINARIESLGAKAGDSVTSKTNFLICGEDAGSKLTKAQSLGIPVLTERQFLEMAGE